MIDEIISGNTASSTTAPSEGISEAVVEPHPDGMVFLQMKTPNGNWMTIGKYTNGGVHPVQTADPTFEYRFMPKDVVKPVRVYFGP